MTKGTKIVSAEPITYSDFSRLMKEPDAVGSETIDPRINDILLHIKDEADQGDEGRNTFIAFPFTKFDNVLGRPRIAETLQGIYGAPYVFLTTQQEVTEEEYSIYFAHIQ